MALTDFLSEPLAIYRPALEEILNARGASALPTSTDPDPTAARANLVAVIPVHGVLVKRRGLASRYFGRLSYAQIEEMLQDALADPEVAGIVLDVDSPGGSAFGLADLSRTIREGRAQKPVKAVVTGVGASAGYWIASAASEVLVAPDALVGGIGTVMSVVDFREADARMGVRHLEIVSSQTPRKNEDPFTDQGRAAAQRIVDDMAAVFVADVARNRRVPDSKVLEDFGKGATFVGAKAVAAGLADGVGSIADAIARMRTRGGGSGPAGMTDSEQRVAALVEAGVRAGYALKQPSDPLNPPTPRDRPQPQPTAGVSRLLEAGRRAGFKVRGDEEARDCDSPAVSSGSEAGSQHGSAQRSLGGAGRLIEAARRAGWRLRGEPDSDDTVGGPDAA